jgi:putative nucleotidyltransferase with HDIG domain
MTQKISVTDEYKSFIFDQLKQLEDYDSLRPIDHVYKFHEHSKRVAKHSKQLALVLGYNCDDAEILYWATLPHDIGKITLPVEIWDLPHKPTDDEKAVRRTHTFEGVNIVKDNFGDQCDKNTFLKLMIDIMINHHEALDGTGFHGKFQNDLSHQVQIVSLCDAFDGWSIARPHFGDRDLSPQSVINRIKIEKAGQFDSDMVDIFENLLIKDR